jgi:hypothetical protein
VSIGHENYHNEKPLSRFLAINNINARTVFGYRNKKEKFKTVL